MKRIFVFMGIITFIINSVLLSKDYKQFQFINPKKIEKRYGKKTIEDLKRLYKAPTKSGLSPAINPSLDPYKTQPYLRYFRERLLKSLTEEKRKELLNTEKKATNYVRNSKEGKQLRKQLLKIFSIKNKRK